MKRKLLFLLLSFLAFHTNAQTVSMIGTALSGWTTDITMNSTDGITYTLNNYTFTTGEAKFRQNGAWDVNWGAPFFPVGSATLGGPNIAVTGGTYNVVFNKNTGAYSFSNAAYPTINMVGDALNGWNNDVTMSTLDGVNYILNDYTFVTGEAKFRQGSTWDTNWGAVNFPNGNAVHDGPNIQVTGGTYDVLFNRNTGDYSFTNPSYPVISIIGTALNGWDTDIEMFTDDGINYTLNGYTFTAGEAKFRQDSSWTLNWGTNDQATCFPNGTGVNAAQNIVIPSGTYNVSFNRISGLYSFTYLAIGLIGSATSGSWFTDTFMNTTDGIEYTLSNISLMAGEVKFRQNSDWTMNWGSNDTPNSFPSGTAIYNSSNNIAVIADGFYDVTFNRNTLAYSFNQLLGTAHFDSSEFTVFPNPSSNRWTITTPDAAIESIALYDVTGKQLGIIKSNEKSVSIDAIGLSKGIYFVKITTASKILTTKLIKE
ncbi:T9SS type A sorting domain-containing protein [Flavobacterium sp. XGLA_31]|uniref:T9SS type A sorting domain-containing protein n=1 Tax=Flavobacterium sp. XGLA_31 TaxID=3447666 RepID=UPI003F35BEFA